MATGLTECVPNFSEGRRSDVLEALSASIRGVPAVRLLDVSPDTDHHRTVFTFVGSPDGLLEAAFRSAALAVARIDMRIHRGVHPRIGAVDVVPFVPLLGVTMSSCVAPKSGTNGMTSTAPMRGCTPRWVRMSIRATATAALRKAASARASGDPTKVKTVR